MVRILDGKELSKKIRDDVARRVESLSTKPVLAIVLATKDESAKAYTGVIIKASEKAGIDAVLHDIGEKAGHDEIMAKVKTLANDKNTHGIIIQTPVSDDFDIDEARSLIPLEKDIDGANPLSAGRLFSGLESFAPATAQAVIEMINSHDIGVSGKNAVIIGRSRIVGKPVAHLLLNMDATVTICHSATKDLPSFTKEADILVVAAGKTGLIGKEHISPDKGVAVIDIGTNFNESGKLVGDVKYDEVERVAGAITPVPGGVGPVTTAILLKNTLEACLNQTGQRG